MRPSKEVVVKVPRQNLRVPGPTPCPDYVLEAMGQPMINHRGPEFRELILRVTEGLKRVFQTESDLYILTASGTGVMEAMVVNTLSPGDKVLAIIIGVFGDRFAQIARAYGAEVIRLDFPWGAAADLDTIRKALKDDPSIKAVLVTHNETSTGVTNDLEAIAGVVKGEFDKLLLVDAISSLACIPLPVDEWRCDVVGTASQKGFMIPPGLGFVSFNQRAWDAYKEARMPRFYFDIGAAKRYLERGQTPFTPAVSIFYALDEALERLLGEGLERVYEHHRKIGAMVRDGVKELGLSLFAQDERYASNTVSAIQIPEGVDGRRLLGIMRENYGIVLAGGQSKLEGKIFRIGHMGYVTEEHIDQVLKALEVVLPQVGFKPARAAR